VEGRAPQFPQLDGEARRVSQAQPKCHAARSAISNQLNKVGPAITGAFHERTPETRRPCTSAQVKRVRMRKAKVGAKTSRPEIAGRPTPIKAPRPRSKISVTGSTASAPNSCRNAYSTPGLRIA